MNPTDALHELLRPGRRKPPGLNPVDAQFPRVLVSDVRRVGPATDHSLAARILVEPAVGDPYVVEVGVREGPPVVVGTRETTHLSESQLEHWRGWQGQIASQLLFDHGGDPRHRRAAPMDPDQSEEFFPP